MRSHTPLLVVIAAGSLWLATSAPAERIRMGVAMDVKTHQSRSTFESSKDHPGEDWLYLTKANADVEFEMRLSVSGQEDSTQKGRTTVSEVPGVTAGVSGYQRARVETFGNEVTLVIETKLTRTKKQGDKDVEEKVDTTDRIPLQSTGKAFTVANLKRGGTFEFRISRAGLKVVLEGGKERTMADVKLRGEGEGVRASVSASAKLLDSRRKGAVFISPERIEYEAPPTRVRAQASLSVHTDG